MMQNDLTLAILNDGKTYSRRMGIALQTDIGWRFRQWASLIWFESMAYSRQLDCPTPTIAEMAQTIIELEAYHAEHRADMTAH